MPITECDGRLFKEALLGSLAWLTVNRDEVDALNVFPVPDGDTGTNMLLTLQSAVEDIRDLDDADLSRTARRASHGALMGARGNSVVILSQILRGFCVGIGSKPSVDARGLANAFRAGADVAYRAVIKPTEGTMLTVAREAAKGAEAKAAETTDLTHAIVELGWSRRRPLSEFMALTDRIMTAGAMPRLNGSGALGLADVAAGRIDAYAELHINLWDVAAALVVLAEAGATVSPFLSGDGLLAGNPILACAPAIAAALSTVTSIRL